jgi:hypothetical protein
MSRRRLPAPPQRSQEPHTLRVRTDPCGCVRLTCSCGHSPQQVVEALGLTLDDLLCEEHRRGRLGERAA